MMLEIFELKWRILFNKQEYHPDKFMKVLGTTRKLNKSDQLKQIQSLKITIKHYSFLSKNFIYLNLYKRTRIYLLLKISISI